MSEYLQRNGREEYYWTFRNLSLTAQPPQVLLAGTWRTMTWSSPPALVRRATIWCAGPDYAAPQPTDAVLPLGRTVPQLRMQEDPGRIIYSDNIFVN